LIEILFWQGCPSYAPARAMLTEEMSAAGIDADELVTIEIMSDQQAQAERFIGSPTIRLDGKDIVDTGDTPFGLECRLYYHRNGRPSPLPDRDDLKEALQNHARKGQ
jgi:hypothetical protein